MKIKAVDVGEESSNIGVLTMVRESMKNTSDYKEESGNNTVTNLPTTESFTEKPISLLAGE